MMEQVKTMATKYATEKTSASLIGAGVGMILAGAYYNRKPIMGAVYRSVSWVVQKAKRKEKTNSSGQGLSAVEDTKEV